MHFGKIYVLILGYSIERKKKKMKKLLHSQEMLMQQRLSPRQILLTKLLQIPLDALLQRIEQEIEENPALEFAEDNDEGDEKEMDNLPAEEKIDEPIEENSNASTEEPDAVSEDLPANDDFDYDDYFNEAYENDDYYNATASKDEEKTDSWEVFQSSSESFQENLFAQLGLFDLSEEDRKIAEFLIGSIDESGYLTRTYIDMANDLLFSANIDTTVDHLKKIVIDVVHKLDPAGVGAKNLQECLLLQVKRLVNKTDNATILACRIIEKYFPDFVKKHFEHIKKSLNCSDEQFEQALAVLLKLNPKPGANFAGTNDDSYIVPDFIVAVNDKTQQLELSLQSPSFPKLKVGKGFLRLYKELKTKTSITAKEKKETLEFMKQKINAAQWFIDALSQRDKTLYKTMRAIIDYQKEFFLSGEEITLKPMILRDIANQIEMDMSTVSRVIRLKYALTPYGVYPLKFFFSESMMRGDGEEVSAYEIKNIIADIIATEDKNNPLTDSALCDMLTEKGYAIARRTVAKYRELTGIPVARLRK